MEIFSLDEQIANIEHQILKFELFAMQKECIRASLPILQDKNLVYLHMQERTGKTLSAISVLYLYHLLQQSCVKLLVITKKKAVEDYQKALEPFNAQENFESVVLNYESSLLKSENMDFDFNGVILDESHNAVSSYPKKSATFTKIKRLLLSRGDVPVIFSSATPYSESYSKLFFQLALCSNSPFSDYGLDFYAFFKDYGVPKIKTIGGKKIKDYSELKEEPFLKAIEPYFYRRTREAFVEPEDVLIELAYSEKQLNLIEKATTMNRFLLNKIQYEVSSPTKAFSFIHQLEGGTIKCLGDKNFYLNPKDNPKLSYLLKQKNLKNIAIFCYYRAELEYLQKYLPKASIFHYTRHAEGIDLSHFEKMIIYTANFSATKFSQVRSRLCRKDRAKPIIVEWLVLENSISSRVFESVHTKNENFNVNSFLRSNALKNLGKPPVIKRDNMLEKGVQPPKSVVGNKQSDNFYDMIGFTPISFNAKNVDENDSKISNTKLETINNDHYPEIIPLNTDEEIEAFVKDFLGDNPLNNNSNDLEMGWLERVFRKFNDYQERKEQKMQEALKQETTKPTHNLFDKGFRESVKQEADQQERKEQKMQEALKQETTKPTHNLFDKVFKKPAKRGNYDDDDENDEPIVSFETSLSPQTAKDKSNENVSSEQAITDFSPTPMASCDEVLELAKPTVLDDLLDIKVSVLPNHSCRISFKVEANEFQKTIDFLKLFFSSGNNSDPNERLIIDSDYDTLNQEMSFTLNQKPELLGTLLFSIKVFREISFSIKYSNNIPF